MADSNSQFIQADFFNQSVRGWAISVRKGMRHNAKTLPKHDSKKREYDKYRKLSSSITYSLKKEYGIVSRVRFEFDAHGFFLHLGVGRGYVRSGNRISRGRKLTDYEKGRQISRGYRRSEVDKMRISTSGKVQRKAIDWFDVEIRKKMEWLAEYTGDFYGDKAMASILEQMDKPLSSHTRYVKTKKKK